MTIADVNQVRIFVSVPESEAAWVDAGFADPAVAIRSPLCLHRFRVGHWKRE